MPRIVAALVILIVLQSCVHTAPTECSSWLALDEASRRLVTPVSCSKIDVDAWEKSQLSGPEYCSTAGVTITAKPEPNGVLDSFAEIRTADDANALLQTLRPEPRMVASTPSDARAETPLGCDQEAGRFYLGNAFLGYLVAYRPDGRELWRISLPHFIPIRPSSTSGLSPRELSDLIESQGGITFSRIAIDGDVVAIAYRVQGHVYDLLIHRSGAGERVVGPWDGLLVGTVPEGLIVDAGGQASYGTWEVPTERMHLHVVDSFPEPLIDHFLARLMPRPTATDWSWSSCIGNDRFVHIIMADKYDSALDATARQIHDGLGPEWAAQIAAYPAVSLAVTRGDLSFKDWKAKLRAALLEAGVDVDCMKYAREHGLASY